MLGDGKFASGSCNMDLYGPVIMSSYMIVVYVCIWNYLDFDAFFWMYSDHWCISYATVGCMLQSN